MNSHGIAELHQRIPFLLSQLGVHIAEDFVVRLRPHGVGPRTYAVLMALAADDGRSQRQLSEQLGIHRNAMVSVIDDLEQRGLVVRQPHPGDRRAFAVTLTDAARELLPALDAHGRAQERAITESLTDDERAEFLGLLQKVSAGLGMSPGVHPKLADGCEEAPH
jgi:DNA-binding MarR family transcriptional regulator